MLSEQARQDQISQDLANAATNGYKPDRVGQRSFADTLLENTRSGQPIGSLGVGPMIGVSRTDFSQGALKDTGAPLDFAISGDGFFQIRTSRGVRFTRDGSFQSNGSGQLTDQLGNLVIGKNGQPVQIKADGTADTSAIGCFKVANPQKAGDGQFTGSAGGQDNGIISSGVIETSGVDAGHTMIELMASLRTYEANLKAITTIDQTLQSAATQAGNIPA
jgi:flagellar basal-body rod protein FlgG